MFSNNQKNEAKSGGGMFGGSKTGGTSGGGGLFGSSKTGTSSSGGGGLFGSSKTGSSGGGGLFGGAKTGSTSGGGLFGSKTGTSGGGGLFGSKTGTSGNNQQQSGFDSSLAPKGFFTGHGLDKSSSSGAFSSKSNMGGAMNPYGTNFMNAYGLVRNGFTQANAYSMMRNNLLFNDESNTDKKKYEQSQSDRVKKFKFLTQKPRSWVFELSHNNPFQKKKVKDLPDKLKEIILRLDKELKNNKKLLGGISEQATTLNKDINHKMKELFEENILSIKMINIKLTKTTASLKDVTEQMKYFEAIVNQIKRYYELYRSSHIKVYHIPSENAITVSQVLNEKLKQAKFTVDELTMMFTKDKHMQIPENTMRLYSGIIEQIYAYLLVILKKGEQLELEVNRLMRRNNINFSDADDGRMEVISTGKNDIASKLESIEKMLKN